MDRMHYQYHIPQSPKIKITEGDHFQSSPDFTILGEKVIEYNPTSEKLVANIRLELLRLEIDQLTPIYLVLGKPQFELLLGWYVYHFCNLTWDCFGQIPIVVIPNSAIYVCAKESYSLSRIVSPKNGDAIMESIFSQKRKFDEACIQAKFLLVGADEYNFIATQILDSKYHFGKNEFMAFLNYEIVLVPGKQYLKLCPSAQDTFLYL